MKGLCCAALLVVFTAVAAPQQPVFKSNRDAVSINVSVKDRNRPVTGLTSRNFQLTDNGVPQTIESVSVEAVPVDVTMFLDTSGSTQAAHAEMARAVERVRQLLRAGDRFRVLTIGVTVENPVPWRAPEGALSLALDEVRGMSLIFDAVFAALAHTPPADTRHIAIALTDDKDLCSVVSPAALRSAAERSDTLLHWVQMGGAGGAGPRGLSAACSERSVVRHGLREATEVTGGEVHTGWFGSADPVKAFVAVFADFRQSYVLRYSPEGVERRGWHKVAVQVPGRRVTLRARNGYFVE